MNAKVRKSLYDSVDKYFYVEDLNMLLMSYIQEKEDEQCIWSNLTLNTHFMLGGNSPNIYQAAALTELIVLSLDILDDLQDNDNLNKSWMKCKRENTMNAVIGFLFASITELSRLTTNKDVALGMVQSINQSILIAINGQHKDLNNLIQSENDYIKMVEEKSSSLVWIASEIGTILVEEYELNAYNCMKEISRNIGIAAQINNDIADILRFDMKNDLLNRRKTLPTLFLLSDLSVISPVIKEYYEEKISKELFLEHKNEILDYIRDSGVIEYTKTVRTWHLLQAEQLFQSVPTISPWNQRFTEITFAALRN